MGIVRNFDQHKYNLPVQAGGPRPLVQGAGIVDTVKSVTDFVTQNKETFKDVGNTVSSVSGAVGNISEAIKAAKRFNELRELQQIKQNKLPANVVNELKAASKKGDGFEKF